MPYGKTLEMMYITRDKPVEPREHPTPGRDRRFRGKMRRKLRKMIQKEERWYASWFEGEEKPEEVRE